MRNENFVSEGFSNGRPDVPEQVRPTTGLQEGQIGEPLKSQGRLAGIRRVLSKLAEKLDTNKQNKPYLGKPF